MCIRDSTAAVPHAEELEMEFEDEFEDDDEDEEDEEVMKEDLIDVYKRQVCIFQ